MTHITTIPAPTHWSDADTCDIERELIGLIIEQQHLDDSARTTIVGVRQLGYHAPSRPGWASVRASRAIRQNRAMEVHYKVERPRPVLAPTAAPAIVKRIGEYDPEARQYPAYVAIDGESEQLVGHAWSAGAADRMCDEYVYHYYADNHTPEVAAAIAVVLADDKQTSEFYAAAQAPAAEATRCVIAGWDSKTHPDLCCIAAQVLLPLAHLRPAISKEGDYLLVKERAEIPAPATDHAIVTGLIDTLNAVAAQLPARPDSITASLHIGGELYQVQHNGAPRSAVGIAPFADVCTSCGDQLNWEGPGLCGTCREAGERWPEIVPAPQHMPVLA